MDPNDPDYAVLVWLNPHRTPENRARLLETVSSPRTGRPLAYPTRILLLTLKTAIQADPSTLTEQILASTADNPVVVPLPIAASHLGWTDYTPSDAA